MQEENDYKKADYKTYLHLIGKLMYLLYRTRSDISFIIGQLSRQNADLCNGHLKVAKRVVCYLEGTIYLGLIYGTILQFVGQIDAPMTIDINPDNLIRYIDSNYPGDHED